MRNLRLNAILLATCTLCGAVRGDDVIEVYFQPDCALAQSQALPGERPLMFAGLATENEDGRHCTVALAKEQFDKLFGVCAVSAIQLRGDQADNYLCAVNYSPWETRFEYRHARASGPIRPLCMFACTCARP